MELYALYKSDKNYLRIKEINELKKEIQETINSLEKSDNTEMEFSYEINKLSFSDFVISQFIEILENMSDKVPD
jgi:flagellar basal body-associated protein FliL